MGRDKIIGILMKKKVWNIRDCGFTRAGEIADEILRSQWIDVNDRLPEVKKVVDMVLVDFNSFEGDQDGIDKVYGVFWDGNDWFHSSGVFIGGKVIGWMNVEIPEDK